MFEVLDPKEYRAKILELSEFADPDTLRQIYNLLVGIPECVGVESLRQYVSTHAGHNPDHVDLVWRRLVSAARNGLYVCTRDGSELWAPPPFDHPDVKEYVVSVKSLRRLGNTLFLAPEFSGGMDLTPEQRALLIDWANDI
jgi:hypothetical protein